MDQTSNVPETYLEQLSTIRPEDRGLLSHLSYKVRFRDYVLPYLCSLALHALLLYIFSLSMFRAPVPVVTSNPVNIWLIPFINSADILSEADLPAKMAIQEKTEESINKDIRIADVPLLSESASRLLENSEPSTLLEPPDAELIVMKQPKAAQQHKPKPITLKVAAVESRRIPSEAIPQKPVTPPEVIRPTAPVGTTTTSPATTPAVAIASAESVKYLPPVQATPVSDISKTLQVPTPTPAPPSVKTETTALHKPIALQQKPSAQETAPARNIRKEPHILSEQAARPQLPAVVVNSAANSATKPAVAVQRADKPATIETPKAPPAAKREMPRGIMAPKVTGDIKFIVTNAKAPQITVSFLDFPATKWNKPLSRNEAKRQSNIVPLVISHDGGYDFVVAKTHPGIYTITASANGNLQRVKFQLILFEGSAKETKKKIEVLNVSDKVVIVKILLPDGILWDDDNAFSGNLEDSESVTKFNTETGLIWKEYK